MTSAIGSASVNRGVIIPDKRVIINWVRVARRVRDDKRIACVLYRTWTGMRERCSNPNSKNKKWYIDRGIGVCEEWDDYSVFRAWALANGFKKGLSLDRINNNGNYSPENCRWATAKQQARNSRTTKYITFRGQTKCTGDWALELGMHRETLRNRFRKGWSLERALTQPIQERYLRDGVQRKGDRG